MIGDGKLFDDTVAPIRGLDNVIIEKRFLTQNEIADIHKEYGIFLCPSRMDTQGVSRDEAMASGLVPVTNKVAAIPEFVDSHCTRLSDPEDAVSLANMISEIVSSPDLFLQFSKCSASNVLENRSKEIIVDKELSVIK